MSIIKIFPELEFRFFSPAEVAELSGVSVEKQRLWRHRHAVTFDAVTDENGVRLLHWGQVMQWALMFQASAYGINLNTAAKIAGSPKLDQTGLHWADMRYADRPPLFVFYHLLPSGDVDVTTGAGKIDFNTGSEFWREFGSWIDYSRIQRRVIGIYQASRKPVVG